jgi:hypothetical protein
MKYYYRNREKIRTGKKLYYQNNKDYFSKKNKEYRVQNSDKLNEYNKKYRLSHKDEIRTKHTKYMRGYRTTNKKYLNARDKSYYWKNRDAILAKHRVKKLKSSNGKVWHTLNKRPYTGYCELCKKEQPYKLNYHHWDDTKPENGVWVCVRCHTVCEGVEKQLVGLYLILKEQINGGHKNGF